MCAYCGTVVSPRTITLDHVTPRRGQDAYDRRDNLVLSCHACNASKADKAFLTFLLARPQRAANIMRYGDHLSLMLLDLARQIAPKDANGQPVLPARSRLVYGPDDDDDADSPYKESPYRE